MSSLNEYDLINEINELSQKLSASGTQMNKYGRELAAAERDYKMILRQEALKLRNTDNMPVTLIDKVIYGVPEVAEARFKRDVAEAMYKTAVESINVLKLKIRILNAEVEREWNQQRR